MDENLLMSLPAALLAGPIESENVMLTTQNYAEKYRELERILAEERKNSEEVKKFYKVLKSDHTRLIVNLTLI